MPAFAPVVRPELLPDPESLADVEVGVVETDGGLVAEARSEDCQLRPTGYAWMMGLV